ncbi:MAG: GcrA family cell cycle regulator [Pseudomonadota bacterium]
MKIGKYREWGNDSQMSWTDERVTILKQLWGEGKTAAEIAKELGEGVTRNAVIGKAHRLKLSSRMSPIQQNIKKKSADKAAPPAPRKSSRKIPVFLGKQLKMEDLRDKMCRWPNGDPEDENFSFCGCETVEGSPYCKVHTEIAYQVTSKARTLNAKDFAEDAGAPDALEIKTASA